MVPWIIGSGDCCVMNCNKLGFCSSHSLLHRVIIMGGRTLLTENFEVDFSMKLSMSCLFLVERQRGFFPLTAIFSDAVTSSWVLAPGSLLWDSNCSCSVWLTSRAKPKLSLKKSTSISPLRGFPEHEVKKNKSSQLVSIFWSNYDGRRTLSYSLYLCENHHSPA